MTDKAAFWQAIAAFATFLTAITGVVRYLLSVHFRQQKTLQLEKAKLDLSVEHVRTDSNLKTIEGISKAVEQIIPILNKHSEIITQFEASVQGVGIIEKGLTTMTNTLAKEYEDFKRIVPKLTVSLEQTLMKVAKIETEVIKVKEDYLFIRNKR